LTGRFDEKTRDRVIAAGALAYLTKPCDQNALIGCIETALSCGRMQPRAPTNEVSV
jgi:DNA-binding NarL/FixJ family response regulator